MTDRENSLFKAQEWLDVELPAGVFHQPTFHSILSDMTPCTSPTLLVGACEDGLPVLLDLSVPGSGSVLILGSEQAGVGQLLRSIFASACVINSPRSLRFTWIGEQAGGPKPLWAEPHCYRIGTPEAGLAVELINELSALAEARKLESEPCPSILLAIEDLMSLVCRFDDAQIQQLKWLVEHGPASRIWTCATLDASHLGETRTGLADSFPTWIIGHIDADQKSSLPSSVQDASPEQLMPGKQFCTLFENEWVRFWMPKA